MMIFLHKLLNPLRVGLSKPFSPNLGNNRLNSSCGVAPLLALDVSNLKPSLNGSGKNSLNLPDYSSKVTENLSKVNYIELKKNNNNNNNNNNILASQKDSSLNIPDSSSKVTENLSNVNIIDLNKNNNTFSSQKDSSSLIIPDHSSKVTDNSSNLNFLDLNKLFSSKKDFPSSSLNIPDSSSKITENLSNLNSLDLNNLFSSQKDLVTMPSLDFPSKIISTLFNTNNEVVNPVNIHDSFCHV